MSDTMNIRGIVLGTTCYADFCSTFKLANQLAKQAKGPFQAVLIEDDSVVQYASLPMVRAISTTGKNVQPVSRDAMRQAYDRDARKIEADIDEVSHGLRTRFSFQHYSGSIGSSVTQFAQTGDLLLYCHQSFDRRREGVLVVETETTQRQVLNELGKTIAQQMGELIQFARLKAGVGLSADEMPSVHEAERELLQMLNRARPVCVVAPLDVVDALGIDLMLQAARCPVMVPVL